MGSLGMDITAIVRDAYDARAAAKKQQAESERTADALEALAAKKEMEADFAAEDGQLKLADMAAEKRVELSRLRVGYAASGVRLDTGSAKEAVADQAAWNEYDRQNVERAAAMESWGLRYDAAILRQKAAGARFTGPVRSNR